MKPLVDKELEVYFITDRLPDNPNRKMILYTKGGVAVIGNWRGELGEFYLGWHPMIRFKK